MQRIFPKSLKNRWKDPKGLIQVFTGPRQVGKTTTALSLINELNKNQSVYASADLPLPPTTEFILDHWKKARNIPSEERTLVLDEVQKIPRWSEVVKQLWEEDKRNKLSMKVCLLGSSALLIEKGLSESLTGRYEINYFPYWTFLECSLAFQVDWQEYCYIGGYPKSYELKEDKERLNLYLQDSVIEPTLGRDVLSLHNVEKPALLRQLFWYVSKLPSQIVSYEKILGHLQGRGNSATLVHYAELLSLAFVLKPISKFSKATHRTKKSTPKWIIPNPALVDISLRQKGPKDFVFENLVGSHLLNLIFGHKEYELMYWRKDSKEVDLILTKRNEAILAIEVKSGRKKNILNRKLLVSEGMDCPMILISRDNIVNFLSTSSVDEIERLARDH